MISVHRLMDRLAATPPDFLADPAGVAVPAVVSDVLIQAGGTALDSRSATAFHSQDANRLRLILIICWLTAEDTLLSAAPNPASGIWRLLTETVPPLSNLVDAGTFVSDEDRREELARLALSALGVTPSGETPAQAEDRLSTVDSVRRHEVLAAARAAEERATAVRAAMAAKRAEEAAARYSQV